MLRTIPATANGCPDSYGKSFYEARSLLNMMYAQELHYSSHCADGNSYRLAQATGINNQVAGINNQATVFPNPNTGMFEVNYNLSNANADGTLSILDLNGKLITTYTLKQAESNAKIDASMFENGVYMYSIQAANTTPVTGKLVIIK